MFSPDGKYLAFVWGNNEKVPYTNGKLKLMDWRSGEIKDLTKTLDRDVENPQWLDNSSLVIQFDDKGKRTLAVSVFVRQAGTNNGSSCLVPDYLSLI